MNFTAVSTRSARIVMEKNDKIVFYFGYHNGVFGFHPEVQEEHHQVVELDRKQSGKLFRAMKEIFKYLTTGD